jgi:hypothetical protein
MLFLLQGTQGYSNINTKNMFCCGDVVGKRRGRPKKCDQKPKATDTLPKETLKEVKEERPEAKKGSSLSISFHQIHGLTPLSSLQNGEDP